MTGESMESSMVKIVQEMRETLHRKRAMLRSEEKTAAKAYQMAMSILDQAAKFVTMKFSDRAYDETYYSVREQRVFDNPKTMYFMEDREWFYQETDTQTRQAFLVYAHGVQMVKSVFWETKTAELAMAEQTGAVEKVFECRMMLDTLMDLLEQWAKLWEDGEGTEYERT